MVTTTSYQTHDKAKQRELDKRQGGSGDGREWLVILVTVSLLVALFVGLIWLASVLPESAGNPDSRIWMMP